ncbi:MAG: quinol:cytochrome C oxidoreductase [Bacteroidota bacterium]|nr:quinol:cytochrome C oxidoreductase [Bacteroidota bacterium]MDP4217201.1 quinol:cytochrome C oxidoreductase [Bacteroidota bacterium]MDP4244811.1 quinol:cytochrome C oxidoreductase [Bacteroidota bacterium]MDP4252582.1 quinol:cytochrome C oxidoreductase [Bacteroidota bacterium]MDP4258430.1 quinol:cytochrome C oxidoreductase [Bacteroidota bacterium]
MASSKEYFVVPGRYKQWTLGLIGVGVLSLIIGFILYGGKDQGARWWAALLQNSVYFLLITNAAMFFFCATTLALAGFNMAFRRVTEAISASVIPIGIITFIILMCIVFGGKDTIYEWVNRDHVANDANLLGKAGFLSRGFFTVWSVLSIGLWTLLGVKMRKMSRSIDDKPLSVQEGKRFIFKNTVWASLYIVWFTLTVASVTPWLWLMSIDPHWASTMYSWYTFASTFVSGIALMTLFVVYLKNRGYLEYVNHEHLHDLGKFQFAFSIFWCYLWFAQFMLIWYANISEETIYFKARFEGAYIGIFYLNFAINFLAPLLIFMSRNAKRNYATVTFMSVLLVFGHWLDFHQMVFVHHFPDQVQLNLFDFGVALGFVGLIMWQTGRVLSKFPLLVRNHPFLKESIIHHT